MKTKKIVHMVNLNKKYGESKSGVDLLDIFDGWKLGDWAVCLHCGRAYKIGEFRLIKGMQMCPYEGCDGDTVMDPVHFPYEGEPERGKIYQLWE